GVTLFSGAADIGQGSDTMLAQMAAEVLGQPMENIKVISADTRTTPVDLGSYSSRVTFMAGNASRNAAIRMRRILVEAACELLEMQPPKYEKPEAPDDFFRQGGRKPDFEKGFLGPNPDYSDGFIIEDGLIRSEKHNASVTYLEAVEKALEFEGILQTSGTYKAPKLGGSFKGAGAGLSPSYSFTAFIVEVTVDPDTGFIKVDKATCAHDCGMPLNPLSVNGQIEGCIHMGLGQALMEEMVYENGATQNPSFLEYKIPSAFEQPEVDIVPCYSDDSEGPFGAKEAGEGILAPIIPAIANAVYDAVGIRLTQLPMRPDRVLSALAKENKKGAKS
ncbi:MAG: molybdopterin-dependent oxidoreductase, partial [Emcibacter sp.]|nr:molybdopterin-dependent oxidoreductase [Emcibacter sp.]